MKCTYSEYMFVESHCEAVPLSGKVSIIEVSASGRLKVEIRDRDGKVVRTGFVNHSTDLAFFDKVLTGHTLWIANTERLSFKVYLRIVK